jgi:replicative DNA helicase
MDPETLAFQEWMRQMEKVHGVAEVVVAKSRHGSTGTIPVKFDAKITRFSDLADPGAYAVRNDE